VLGLLLSLLLCLQALSGSSPAVAQAPGRGAAVVDDAAAAAEAAAVPTELTPLVADFDGDHRSDVFWYGPGGVPDHVFLGRPDQAFVGVPVAVQRSFLPLVGDFNGNGRSDILWYGPGAAPDVFWSGQAGGRFAGKTVTVAGTYQPFTGDFNGDGRRDVFWNAPGADNDSVWCGRADGSFAARSRTVDVAYRPYVGDFGGDHRSDIFWYAPGDPDDTLSFGQAANQQFSSRRTTIDIGHTRALPLRQKTFANQYDPYGFVAHAFGSIDRCVYTNTLEAFLRNYGRGFRVFETDVVRLKDGTALLAHDGLERNYGLDKSFRERPGPTLPATSTSAGTRSCAARTWSGCFGTIPTPT
jgi:hypothetical protein